MPTTTNYLPIVLPLEITSRNYSLYEIMYSLIMSYTWGKRVRGVAKL